MRFHESGSLRPAFAVLLAVTAGTFVAACGERAEDIPTKRMEPFAVALDSRPGADHAPVFMALKTGLYRKVGLDVKLVEPASASTPIQQVAADRVDLAISSQPEVFAARQAGLHVIAVGALVQKPLTSLVSLRTKDPIPDGRALSGKRIGTAGLPYQEAYVRTIAQSGGVDPRRVKTIDVGDDLAGALLSGKVDGVLGMFWNVGGIELAREHRSPLVKPVDKLGVPDYDELVFVASESGLRDHDDLVRYFMSATATGARAVRANPSAAARAIARLSGRPETGLLRASTQATMPTFFPDRPGRPFGYLDAIAWQKYGAWMAEYGLLDRRPDVSTAITDRYLPSALLEP